MPIIRFKYMGNETILETSKYFAYDILKEYSKKINVDIQNLYFLYRGIYLSTNEKDKQNITKIYKKNNIINVFNIRNKRNKNESNFILCPICKSLAIIYNNEDKINIYGCPKNHSFTELNIEQFINSQYNNKQIIKCSACKCNMNLFKKNYYLCTCDKIFCSECNNDHKNKARHNMINYKERFYNCTSHGNIFKSYCNTCKKNLCFKCEKEHYNLNHKITLFKKIEENKKKLYDIYGSINELKEKIKQYELELKAMKELFEKVFSEQIEKLRLYKRLYHLLNFTYNNIKNYESHQIMNYINIKKLFKNLNTFLNYNIDNKFKHLIDSYNFSKNQLTLIFQNKEKKDKIRIFSEEFVKNNKNNGYILINNAISQISEFYIDKEKKARKMIKINLIKDKINIKSMFKDCDNIIEINGMSNLNTDDIFDLSYMFHGCSSLISISDISDWIIVNTINMKNMFYGCSSLTNLPDISKWKTLSVKDMSYMFYGCSSITYLPDISKWNTDKVTNMNNIFSNCSSLMTLPDISKWNTDNVKDMNNMFSFCKSLVNLPNISNWNTRNVIDMNCMFHYCSNLRFLPDISQWNTENLLYLNGIFSYCSSLSKLANISNWNVSKVINMNGLFYNCKSLKQLPDISKWKVDNVINMKGMFGNCESLSSLPDLSKWNTCNVNNMSKMFINCKSLSSFPDISNWDIKNVIYSDSMFSFCLSLKKYPDLSKWFKSNNKITKEMLFNTNKYQRISSEFDIVSWQIVN